MRRHGRRRRRTICWVRMSGRRRLRQTRAALMLGLARRFLAVRRVRGGVPRTARMAVRSIRQPRRNRGGSKRVGPGLAQPEPRQSEEGRWPRMRYSTGQEEGQDQKHQHQQCGPRPSVGVRRGRIARRRIRAG
eukprot:scaffold1453_cov112-Isochrysis_galbana.AAC.16